MRSPWTLSPIETFLFIAAVALGAGAATWMMPS
jgi:hypothetical protein